MKTKLTSTIAKISLLVFFALTTMMGYGQQSRPDIASGVPCTVVDPGPVSGSVNVCPYIGTGDQLTYSIDLLPQASSYEWIVPPSVTLISGQGSESITVTIGSNFTSFANKQIRVRAQFPCGTSQYRVFYLVAQGPMTPKPITAGSTNICSFVGTNNAVSYTIKASTAATSYNWTNPPFTTILHPGSDAEDTTVLLIFNTGFTGGSITVQCSNNCGVSGTRSLAISTNLPPKPGLISGNTNVCGNLAPNGTAATYSVSPVSGATSYDWTAPDGAFIEHPNGSGPNDFTITVLYPQGFALGNITVASANGCGASAARSLVVKILGPSAPGPITPVAVSVCPNRVYTYSVAALPLNANSIHWEVPVGGTILSGQGTTSIIVSYNGDPISGNVSAAGVSNCAAGVARTLAVNLEECTGGRIGKPVARISSATTGSEIMVLNVYPNPTVGEFKVMISTAQNAEISVRLFDLSGRMLKRIAIKRNETISFGDDLRPGSYILEVIQGNTRKVQKLIKY